MGDNNCPPADCGSSPQTHDVQGSDASSPELACAAPTRRKFKCSSCGRKGERSHTCHKCVICIAHSADEHIDPAGHAPSCIRYDPDAATVVCTICHATFTAKSILITHQERKHDLHTCPSCNAEFVGHANLHTHRSAGCGAANVATTNSQSCGAIIDGVRCGRIGKTASTCTRCTCRGHTNDADTDFAGHLPLGCDACVS